MKKLVPLLLILTASQAFGQTLKIEVSTESVKMVQMVTGHKAEDVLGALWQQATINAGNQIMQDVIKRYDQATKTEKK